MKFKLRSKKINVIQIIVSQVTAMYTCLYYPGNTSNIQYRLKGKQMRVFNFVKKEISVLLWVQNLAITKFQTCEI